MAEEPLGPGAPAITGLRILLVDDHLVIRRELTRLVIAAGATVVGEAGTVAAALAEAGRTQPDVIILDLNLPDGSGLDVMAPLRQASPSSRIVILSASNDSGDIRRGLAAGANGYLTKDLSGAAVVGAIASATGGVTAVTNAAVASLLTGDSSRAAGARELISRLSAREREVLALLADGLSAAEAAGRLGLSTRTIEGHATSLLSRLGVRNRAEAVRIFVEGGGSSTQG